MGLWTDVVGTVRGYIRLGLTGVRLKNSSGTLVVRDAGDSADAAVTTSKVNVSGDSIDINSDAAGSGADWKYTVQRPASGMTAAVTLTLPPDVAAGRLVSDGSGNLSWDTGTVYEAGGTDVALADGGTGASLSDPNADRIMFWDDSAGAVTWLTAGSGLTITGTTITASGSSSRMPRSHISGLVLSNNESDATNDIDIAAGEARDSTNAEDIILASALTKRLDAAWAVGTAQGGLDTGSIANATYHVWLIKRSDTGVVDVLFSLSATAPTMPTNYDYKRRIGSIIRASGAIVPFVQDHIRFMRKTPVTDVNAAAVNNATAVTRNLSVPTGIRVGAINTLVLGAPISGAQAIVYYVLSDLSSTGTAAGPGNAHVISSWDGTAFGVPGSSGFVETMTNTSAQISSRGYSTNYAGVTITIGTHGWVDYGLLSGG